MRQPYHQYIFGVLSVELLLWRSLHLKSCTFLQFYLCFLTLSILEIFFHYNRINVINMMTCFLHFLTKFIYIKKYFMNYHLSRLCFLWIKYNDLISILVACATTHVLWRFSVLYSHENWIQYSVMWSKMGLLIPSLVFSACLF